MVERIGALRPDTPDAGRAAAWLLPAVYALACLPLLLTAAPPLLDYPNHLARIWLLAGGAAHPPLSAMYVVDWSQAATNVAVDALGAALGHMLPFAAVDRILRLLMFLGAPLGVMALARAVFGRVGIWHLAPVLLIWTTTTVLGFLSYSVALGAAMFCAAALPALHRRMGGWVLLPHTVFAALLFAIHPFGLVFYLVIVAGLILGPDCDAASVRRERARLARQGAAALLPCAALVLIVSAAAPHPPSLARISGFDLSAQAMLETALSPMLSYERGIDLLSWLPVVVFLAAGFATRRIASHRGLVMVALLLVPLALLAPRDVGDASMINRRLPLMIALLLLAGVYPRPRLGRWPWLMPALMIVASVGRIAWISDLWLRRDRDFADLAAVTRTVTPGSAVVVARYAIAGLNGIPVGRRSVDGEVDLRRELPSLLVIRNSAFIPTLFAIEGQQPLRVSDARDADAEGASLIPEVGELWHGGDDAYLARWRCDFEYLLLLDPDVPDRPPFDARGLRKVAARGFAELYAIDAPRPGQSCGPVSSQP